MAPRARTLAEPLSLLLTGAATLPLVVWWLQGAAGAPVDSLVIAAMRLLNTGIGAWQQARADQAVAALARLSAAQASVRHNGQLLRVTAAGLVRGDLLVPTKATRWPPTPGCCAPAARACCRRP
jgi:Ca2+-transporting ATPase